MIIEEIKQFCESSTIHGLNYISIGRKWSRLFWILVVIGGFSGAGYLIHLSFDNWNQSPISTTIETLPISQITFPNVTVCPPENSYLDLNYDIMKSNETKIDQETREELFENSKEIIQENFFKEMMKNLSKLEDSDRFYNWYHGYTQVQFPFYFDDYNRLNYIVEAWAKSGNISTKYFGESFHDSKVDGNIYVAIKVNVPESAKKKANITLNFDIKKNVMKEFVDLDKISFGSSSLRKC